MTMNEILNRMEEEAEGDFNKPVQRLVFEKKGIWKALNEEEVIKFRAWARENYKPFSEINILWHPIVKDECLKIDKEEAFKRIPKF